MNPKKFFTKSLSTIASLALAIGGSLIATQPASATFDPLTTMGYQSAVRGAPQISGNNITDTVALQSGETAYGYSMTLDLASVGSPYVLTTALTSSNKPSLTFAATSGGTALTTNSSNTSWWIEYYNGTNYLTWDPNGGQTLPTGTYTSFRIQTSGNFSGSQIGPKTISITAGISINSSAVSPLAFSSINATGMNVNLPSNALSYTPVAGDQRVNAQFRACIWLADQSGLAVGDTVNISASNSVINANTTSYIDPNIFNNGNYVSPSSVSATEKSFVVPVSSTMIETSMQVYANNITVGAPISFLIEAKKNGTGANMFDTCFKTSPSAAATPTVAPNGTTTTISWAAPSDLSTAGYTNVYVLACASNVATCATVPSLTSMMNRGYTFTNATSLALNTTTFTATASSMSAGMGSPTTWSSSTAYKYAVVYLKTFMFQAGWISVLPGIVWIGGPTAATSAATTPSPTPTPTPTSSTPSVPTVSVPTPVFQAPILNSLAPKMSSGLSSNGGKLVLKDVKPTDITSVKLNGKTIEVTASKSGSALKIPARSTAGDLTFTMADGSIITVPNAVKVTQSNVDPALVDLYDLPKFNGNNVAVPAAIKAALTKRTAIISDSVSAKCVGYATANTAAAKAVALARAAAVCGVITDINENIDPLVKVVVSKTIAKKSPVRYQTW